MDGRRISIMLAVLVAASLSSQALGCIVIAPDNRDLFKDAMQVHEAVATSSQFSFDVYRTWRGEPVSEVVLPRAWKESLQWCTDQGPVEEGRTYLLVISCREPDHQEVPELFSCPARVEAVEDAEHRIHFLEEGWVVTRQEIADHLDDFVLGHLTPSELTRWLRRAFELGDVDDWIPDPEDPGSEVSVTDEVLNALESMLGNSELPKAPLSDPCVRRAMYVTVAPSLLSFLRAEPPVESDDELMVSLADLLWEVEDICLFDDR